MNLWFGSAAGLVLLAAVLHGVFHRRWLETLPIVDISLHRRNLNRQVLVVVWNVVTLHLLGEALLLLVASLQGPLQLTLPPLLLRFVAAQLAAYLLALIVAMRGSVDSLLASPQLYLIGIACGLTIAGI